MTDHSQDLNECVFTEVDDSRRIPLGAWIGREQDRVYRAHTDVHGTITLHPVLPAVEGRCLVCHRVPVGDALCLEHAHLSTLSVDHGVDDGDLAG